MLHLKLKKAMSYTGHGITVTRERPDFRTEHKLLADVLVASGYFDLCPDGTPDTPPPHPENGTITAIDAMNATQLRAYAKKHGLDIDEIAPKGSSVEKVREAVLAALGGSGEAEEDVSDQFSTSESGEEDEEPGEAEEDATSGDE